MRVSESHAGGAPAGRLWLWCFGLLGAAASVYASWVHYHLLTDVSYAAVCDVNATFSCSTAYASSYGSLFGVSTALWGVAFFALVVLLFAVAEAVPTLWPPVVTTVVALAAIGVPVVLYLAVASVTVLKSLCLVCLVTYVAVAGLTVSAVKAIRSPMRALPGRVVSDIVRLVTTPASAVALVALAIAAAGAVAWFPSDSVSASAGSDEQAAAAAKPSGLTPAQQQELEKFLAAQQRVPVMVATEGAAVVLVKFNDYMCPPCGQTFAEYKPVLARYAKEYPGKLKFVSRDYPLDPECNRLAPGGSHLASCEAAVAVRLAREKGKADAMENWLFANQPSLTPASVKEAARTLGGVTDFDARYASTLQLVKGDIEQGGQLQVQGTPTFFMNGIRLPGLRAEFLDAAIALEMKRAGVTVR